MWDTITAPAPTHLKIVHHPEIDTEEREGNGTKNSCPYTIAAVLAFLVF